MTMSGASHESQRPAIVEAVVELFWFGVTIAITLTAAVFVVVGPRAIEAPTTRWVVVVLLVLFAGHAWRLHRRRGDRSLDPRARHDRERRGF